MPRGRLENSVIRRSRSDSAYIWSFSLALQKVAPAFFILLSITLIAFSGVNSSFITHLRTSIINSISPLLTISSAPIISLFSSIDNLSDLRDLKAKNIFLTSENKKLIKWYEAALTLHAENKSLRDLLNVKIDKTLNFVTSRVISDAGSSFVKSVLLPVGSRDGIIRGSAVMSGEGLIGRVTESGDNSSRVLLVTDLNSRIPVIIQNTGIRAIVAGKNKDLLKLERLPHDSGITIGSRIVTSGDGGQLPANIPIGTIISSNIDGVWVKPISNISKLVYVQVVNVDIGQGLVSGNVGK